jgi:hypothetical protein
MELYICFRCKHFYEEPDIDENGKCRGAYVFCRRNNKYPNDKCLPFMCSGEWVARNFEQKDLNTLN